MGCPEEGSTNMSRSRISRCLQLVCLLNSRTGCSVREIARECDVSRRTTFRDLDLLRRAGLPLRYDPKKGGYLVGSNTGLKAVFSKFHPEELAILALAASTSVFASTQHYYRVVNQALGKLLMTMPEASREAATRLLRMCVVDHSFAALSEREDTVRSGIVTAIRWQRRIRITYRAVDESSAVTTQCTSVAPYRLVASSDGWCLIGRSSFHRGVRRFALKQIQQAEVTQDTYEIPPRFRCTIAAEGLAKL